MASGPAPQPVSDWVTISNPTRAISSPKDPGDWQTVSGSAPAAANKPSADNPLDHGFLQSMWDTIKALPGAFIPPHGMKEQGDRVAADMAIADNPKADPADRKAAHDRVVAVLPFGSTVLKAQKGNYAGAAGDLALPAIATGIGLLPEGTGGTLQDVAVGTGKGIAKSADLKTISGAYIGGHIAEAMGVPRLAGEAAVVLPRVAANVGRGIKAEMAARTAANIPELPPRIATPADYPPMNPEMAPPSAPNIAGPGFSSDVQVPMSPEDYPQPAAQTPTPSPAAPAPTTETAPAPAAAAPVEDMAQLQAITKSLGGKDFAKLSADQQAVVRKIANSPSAPAAPAAQTAPAPTTPVVATPTAVEAPPAKLSPTDAAAQLDAAMRGPGGSMEAQGPTPAPEMTQESRAGAARGTRADRAGQLARVLAEHPRAAEYARLINEGADFSGGMLKSIVEALSPETDLPKTSTALNKLARDTQAEFMKITSSAKQGPELFRSNANSEPSENGFWASPDRRYPDLMGGSVKSMGNVPSGKIADLSKKGGYTPAEAKAALMETFPKATESQISSLIDMDQWVENDPQKYDLPDIIHANNEQPGSVLQNLANKHGYSSIKFRESLPGHSDMGYGGRNQAKRVDTYYIPKKEHP